MLTQSVDLPSPATRAFWDRTFAERLDQFAQLRACATPQFHTEPDGPGFWSLVHYDSVVDASRRPQHFSSAEGFTIANLPPEVIEGSMVAMDDPRHRRFRGIVQGAFTHNAVRKIADQVRATAETIVREMPKGTPFNFVTFSSSFPLQVICALIGIPEEDRAMIERLADDVVGVADNQQFTNSPGGTPGLAAIGEYAYRLGEQRQNRPTGDVISRLLAPTADGQPGLSPAEWSSFLVLLITAGYDTTRQALTWAMHLLSTHTEQRNLLLMDFDRHIDNFIAEVIRWASPVPYMRRTATMDLDFHGTRISAGDKVVMWYLAANHDESVFDVPARFDIERPNAVEHLGFGAKDPHHCLGVNLAKLELRTMLKLIFDAHPSMSAVDEPKLVLSAFVSGIDSLTCQAAPI